MEERIEKIRESFSLPRKMPKEDRESINIRDEDEEYEEDRSFFRDPKAFFLLSLEALGVVYGDIGTSPLYTLSSILLVLPNSTDEDVIGATSLIIWSIFILVTLKYGSFILTADYRSEGGIFALCSLLLSKCSTLSPTAKRVTIITCIVGASLLLGDGAITPAISVLSAISGIAVVNAELANWVVPITVIVLILLFLVQPFGTSTIGKGFGPIVLVWMGSIFGVGIYNISANPYVLYSFNPTYAISYLSRNGAIGYLSLGAVFLSVTGLEAMYADLGHFRKGPIRFSWLFIVMPSVIASYLGQASVAISNPSAISTLFYSSTPTAFYWPMFVLAAFASIIASQAIITGSYSVISQAISLGFAPPVEIINTSKKIKGQIYVPLANWILMILTIAVVLGFQTSSDISNAYGVTICTMMVMTTCLFMANMRYVRHFPLWKVLPFGLFLIVDCTFLGAIYSKIPNGGYVAIINAAVFCIPMLVWYLGEQKLKFWIKSHDTSSSMEDIQGRFVQGSFVTPDHSESSKGKQQQSSSKSQKEKILDNENDDPIDPKPYPKSKEQKSKDQKSKEQKSKDQKSEHKSTSSSSPPQMYTSSQVAVLKSNKADLTTSPRPRKSSVYVHMQHSDKKITVLPQAGIFLCTSKTKTPLIFEDLIARFSGIPATVIFFKPTMSNIGRVEPIDRIKVKKIGENIFFVAFSFGYSEFMKEDTIERVLKSGVALGLPAIPMDGFTVFASAEIVKISNTNWLWKVVLYLYSIMKRVFFGLYVIDLPSKETIYVTSVASL